MSKKRRKRRRKPSLLRQKFAKRMQLKLVLVFGFIILAFVLLAFRITYINASDGDRYTKIVLEQQQYSSSLIPFKRGDIVDSNGTKLATSERVYNVILDVKALLTTNKDKVEEYKKATIEALVEHFEIEEEEILKAIEERPESRYYVLKKTVDYNTAKAYEKATEENYNIKGVWLEEDYIRTYPYSTLACDVIGFSVGGNVGATGLEASYNDVLNGTDGRRYGYQNDDADMEQTVKEAENGNTIVTTIDTNLQSIVEKHLSAFNEEYRDGAEKGDGFKNGAVIMMQPNTGEILAMASFPNYDLNNPRDLSAYYSEEQLEKMTSEEKLEKLNALWQNFCVSDTFEPGSTIKPFTVATGLEIGTLDGSEHYYCSGYHEVAGQKIKCVSYSKGGHGSETLAQAVENSCNPAMMQIAADIGAEEFCKYQHIFGFGEYTGIDLPGDALTSGLLYSAENMGPVDLATNSFGQNFNVTMVQLASAFCSLINGGNYYEPHLVKAIQDDNGNTIETIDPVLTKRTISKETSELLKTYLYGVVENGSGKSAAVEGYAVGGKTGTAEKLPRNNGKYLLSFIGYAPQENPEVVIYVVIDEPNAEYQNLMSSKVSGLASDIMTEAFPYLNITKKSE